MSAHVCRLSTRASTAAIRSLAGAALALAASGASAQCKAPSLQALSGNVKLENGCVYNERVNIVASGTTLDCNGATFDGRRSIDIGLLIDAQHQAVNNVTVRNCTFRNYTKNGVRVILRGPKPNRDDSYRRAPTDVTIESSSIEGSGEVGLYVSAYSTRVTLRQSTIKDTAGAAIYLDFSSRNNQIVDNKFINNGFGKDGKRQREAIAVDSSYDNLISGNLFDKNGRGGIFLYKNCGEKASAGAPIRVDGSDNNKIVNNRFIGEPVGVWIAARQSTNLSKWDCADAPMDKSKTYYEDFASKNTVTGNQFCGIKVAAVRVEGDNNSVEQNSYDATTKSMVDLPITKRGEILGRPPVGNTVAGNRIVACGSR